MMPKVPRGAAWLVRIVVLVVFISVVFLAPLGAGQHTKDPSTITSYAAAMKLARDGTLTIDETITVDLAADRHGIFRIFDTTDPRRDVDHPISEVNVTRDGQPEEATFTAESRGARTLRIGDPNVILDPGEHVYEIHSVTTDVFEPGKEGETLWWWDVVGTGWQMAMEKVHISAVLPTEPLRPPECVQDKDTRCTASVDGTTMTVDIPDGLAPYTPVTVRVPFDSSKVPADGGPASHVGTIVWSIVAFLIAAGVALLLWRETREKTPGLPVLFEPPEGVGPALGVRVLNEERSSDDLQATLFDLGERGIVKLSGSEDQWIIDLLAPTAGASLSEGEGFMLMHLGLADVGDRFTVSHEVDAGERVQQGPLSAAFGCRVRGPSIPDVLGCRLRGHPAGMGGDHRAGGVRRLLPLRQLQPAVAVAGRPVRPVDRLHRHGPRPPRPYGPHRGRS